MIMEKIQQFLSTLSQAEQNSFRHWLPMKRPTNVSNLGDIDCFKDIGKTEFARGTSLDEYHLFSQEAIRLHDICMYNAKLFSHTLRTYSSTKFK
eukprot:Awhi_evm2s15441